MEFYKSELNGMGVDDETVILAKESNEYMGEVIKRCYNLVVSRIKFKNTTISFDDLVQVGIMGLIDAVEKFDPSKNASFCTYAVYHIDSKIKREIFNNSCEMSMPESAYKAVYEVKKFCNSFRVKPSDECLKDFIILNYKKWSGKDKCSEGMIQNIIKYSKTSYRSLNIENEDGSSEIEVSSYDHKTLYKIENIMSILSPLEASVMCMRFFLEMSLENIGKMNRRGKDWARGVIEKSIEKIRLECDLRNLSLDDFMIELI